MTRRPHVLILVENLSVPFDRRVWQEAVALQESGHRVTVVCPRDSRSPQRRENLQDIDIRRFWLPPEGRAVIGLAREYIVALLGMFALAVRVAVRRRVDVVHVCNPPDLLFLVARLLRLLQGASIVFDHHDANPELALQRGFRPRGVMHQFLLILEALTFRSAQVVISTNDSYRELAMSRGGKGADEVFVVRSAPRAGLFDSGRNRPELRRGRELLVLYLGVMGPQDGVDILIDAISCMPEPTRQRTQFVLVGDGPESGSIHAQIGRLGLSDGVHMTGRISDSQLADYLATADICVNPDPPGPLNDISTMNKVVEYLATGNPIVQFDTREGRHSAGDASLYSAPGAEAFAREIERLIGDGDLRRDMGARGRERFGALLAWERQVPALLEAYRCARSRHRLLERRSHRRRGEGP